MRILSTFTRDSIGGKLVIAKSIIGISIDIATRDCGFWLFEDDEGLKHRFLFTIEVVDWDDTRELVAVLWALRLGLMWKPGWWRSLPGLAKRPA